jgi:hypothetical protein
MQISAFQELGSFVCFVCDSIAEFYNKVFFFKWNQQAIDSMSNNLDTSQNSLCWWDRCLAENGEHKQTRRAKEGKH